MIIKLFFFLIFSLFLQVGHNSTYASTNKCAGFYSILANETEWRNFFYSWDLVRYSKTQAQELLSGIPSKIEEIKKEIDTLGTSLKKLSNNEDSSSSKAGPLNRIRIFFSARDLKHQLETKKESLSYLTRIEVKLKDIVNTFASGLATPSFRGFVHPRFTISSEHPNKSEGRILGSTDMIGLGFDYRLVEPNVMEFEGSSRGMGAKYAIKLLPSGGIELDGGIAGIWANYRTIQVSSENSFVVKGETRGLGAQLEIFNPGPNLWRATGSQSGRVYDFTLEFSGDVPKNVQKLLFLGSAIHM